MEKTEETKVKRGRPKTKSPPIKDALTDSKLAVKEQVKETEPVKEKKEKKEKKDKKEKVKSTTPASDTKLKDSLKELSKVATANKKEIININKKIDNIIKKIKD
jgi:hypothetical protein